MAPDEFGFGDLEPDDGNVNGEVLDDPKVNGAVVGVPYDAPDAGDTPATPSGDTDDDRLPSGYDPGDYTVAEVAAELAHANDAERSRVLELERAGQGRVGIVGHDDDED
jgi:hypothetical protein